MNMHGTYPFQLRELLETIFKRKKEILIVWFSIVGLVVAYSLIAQPVFESSSRILIKVGRENTYVSPLRAAEDSAPIVDSNLEEQMNSEIEILKGRALAEKVVESIGPQTLYPNKPGFFRRLFGLAAPAVADDEQSGTKAFNNSLRMLEANLKVEGIKKTNVIRVTFRHVDPALSARVVGAIVNSYLEQHLRTHQDNLSITFLTEQAVKLKRELQTAEASQADYMAKHKIVSPDEQKKLLLQMDTELRAELQRTEIIEAEAASKVQYYRSQIGPNPAFQNIQENLLKNEAELKGARAKKAQLIKHLGDDDAQLRDLSRAEDGYLLLQQQVDLARQNLRFHQSKLHEASYLDALGKEKIANVSVIDPPSVPLEPVGPKIQFNILISVLLGAIAGFGLAFWRESMDDRLSTPQDIERFFGDLPVLATFPFHSGEKLTG